MLIAISDIAIDSYVTNQNNYKFNYNVECVGMRSVGDGIYKTQGMWAFLKILKSLGLNPTEM